MSKTIYTLANSRNQDIGLGSIGILPSNRQGVFSVEEDSTDEVFLGQIIAQGLVTLVSAVPAQSAYGPANLTAAQTVAVQGLVAGTLSETSPYVTMTATGNAFTGACVLAGWYCSVAVGNITIYDALSATGTPIVPATALTVGPLPILGAGTTGKLVLTTGLHVVLSGAATVRMLVA